MVLWIGTRLYQAQQLAANNGIVGTSTNPLGPQNSIEHAYTSATLQRDYGAYSAIAEILGNARESQTTFKPDR